MASALILNIRFISSFYSYNVFSRQAYLEFHVRFHPIFGSEQSLFLLISEYLQKSLTNKQMFDNIKNGNEVDKIWIIN